MKKTDNQFPIYLFIYSHKTISTWLHFHMYVECNEAFFNQSGAWYAEAVDRVVIRKLEKLKHNSVLKNSADGGQGEICIG